MDNIEKFLKKYSYKFPKGYPDIKNNQDVLLLEKILKEELGIDKDFLLNEEAPAYDNVIKNKLKKLPIPKGNYKLGQDIQLSGEDAKIFKELYPISPPKKGADINSAGSKGSGNGEVALYWILNKNHDVKDGRGGGAPDLIVNGKGVEVKAYDTKKITLGRFSSDTENVALLNTLFGLNSLVSSLDKSAEKTKEANSLNFTRGDVIKAFETLKDFSSNKELRTLSTKYTLIKNIFDKVDELVTTLKLPNGFKSEDASSSLIKRIIAKKISEKPGDGGYLVNVSDSGKIHYKQITLTKLSKAPSQTILDNVAINQGQIIINPEAIF